MSAMFDDDEGRRLGQIEDLAGAVADGHPVSWPNRRPRKSAESDPRLVGLGDLEQSFPLMAFLSARRSSRWLA